MELWSYGAMELWSYGAMERSKQARASAHCLQLIRPVTVWLLWVLTAGPVLEHESVEGCPERRVPSLDDDGCRGSDLPPVGLLGGVRALLKRAARPWQGLERWAKGSKDTPYFLAKTPYF